MKVIILFLLILVMGILLLSCMDAGISEDDVLFVTDIGGSKVEVPSEVNRIAVLSASNHLVLHMLNGADKIVATTQPPLVSPWYRELFPEALDIPVIVNRDRDPVNIEELLALNPCVVVTENYSQLDQLRGAGLAAIYVNRLSFENIVQSIRITAAMLNNGSEAIANEYIDYLEDNISRIYSIVSTLSDDEKPRVFFSRSSQTSASRFVTFGSNTVVNDWIELCGGINVMSHIDGSREISVEEFIAADPEIILIRGSNAHGLGGGERIRNYFLNDPALSEVTAIRNGAVYLCPVGLDMWSVLSVEMALHIQWASRLFHPELFYDDDIVAEAISFYERFFGIFLSEYDIGKMLLQLNPGDVLPIG